MSKLKSGSYDITLEDKINSLTGSFLPILKAHGAPILGSTSLRFDPRYTFTFDIRQHDKSTHITWSPK